MPKLPDFRQPTKSDIPELEDSAVKALDPVSKQIDRLTRASQGKLSHYDNFNCDVRDLALRNGVPAVVAVKKIRGKPTGLDILYTSPGCHASGFMEVVDDQTVRITVSFSRNPQFTDSVTGDVTTRIRVWGD